MNKKNNIAKPSRPSGRNVLEAQGAGKPAANDNAELGVQLSRCFVAGRGGAVSPLRVSFYIDALNLYYGALRHTSHRWLDIVAFCQSILREKRYYFNDGGIPAPPRECPPAEIAGIKIFAAPLKKVPWDEDAPQRQKIYYTALRAHDTGRLIKPAGRGKFSLRKVWARDAADWKKQHRVYRPEEKGSDVNLALHMLNDAVNNEYDCAVMVSNDTDLENALPMVREHGKIVGVVFPRPKKVKKTPLPAKSLEHRADFYLNIRQKMLAANQLPDVVQGGNGAKLAKPDSWDAPRASS